MELSERIKAKMLGGNPVPLENLCDLPSSMGYDRVAGTIRALHGVADDLNSQVEALEAERNGLSEERRSVRKIIGAEPYETSEEAARRLRDALALCRRLIRGEMIEHAIVDQNRPNLGLGEHLDSILK